MKKILFVCLTVVLLLAIVPIGIVSAETLPTITISNVWGAPGSNVDITISISNNPGIIASAFCVSYDSNSFEYIGYKEGYLTNYNIKDHSDKGFVSFVSVENEDLDNNGDMLTLTFKIKETAEYGEYAVDLLNNNPDKYGDSLHNSFANSKEQYIVPIVEAGTITVSDETPFVFGDVNNDGAINNKDLGILMQYLNEFDVKIVYNAADVTGDGIVNNKDYGLLMQYCNGWDVILGGKTSYIADVENYGNQGPLVFF